MGGIFGEWTPPMTGFDGRQVRTRMIRAWLCPQCGATVDLTLFRPECSYCGTLFGHEYGNALPTDQTEVTFGGEVKTYLCCGTALYPG